MQPRLPAMEYAARSDPGRDPDKQINEDACVARETRFGHLCLVCDGMGGHASGREAAERATTIVIDVFEQAPDGMAPAELLRRALEEANRGVYALGSGEVGSGRPGCTAVALLMHAHGTEVAHVGDSRAYVVHEGQIFRLTRDHSVVQELVERGLLTPAQAAHHPDANRITRALGIAPDVDVEVRPAPLAHVSGDAFILCSDGLSDLVEDADMLAIVGSSPAAQAVGRLVDLANARGGHDNITAVVLRAKESAEPSASALLPTVPQTTVPPPSPSPPASAAAARTLLQSPAAASPLALAPLLAAPGASPAPAASGASGLAPGPSGPAAVAEFANAAAAPRLASNTSRSETMRPRAGGTGRALVAIVLASACLVAAGLGAVLVHECSERSGKPSARTQIPSTLLPPVDAAVDAPTPLAPEAVVVPPAEPPAGEPLAPLQPAPTSSDGKKRRHPL